MLLQCFSIYDKVAEVYGTPFFTLNANVAARMFSDLAKDPTSTIHKNPDDFDLFMIGFFDDSSATFDTNSMPKFMVTAKGVMHVE